ncbi:MAG: aspartate--tRNA ligase [SAR202 cluster bacterium]|nr:aspartate--tRNA ligase [SAR202 cluster bacterium]
MYKTTGCGDPRKSDVGKRITAAGWVHRRRDHGSLIFIDLRDRSGLLQVVFNPALAAEAHRTAESLRSEWVIQVGGTVVERKPGAENPKMPTGDVELTADSLVVLNASKTPPFEVDDESPADENLRLRYRFIDLRRPRMQELLRLRHRVTRIMWDHLEANDFLQVETPILLKSTPEGARDYVVPSRLHAGKFYALPQSPQQLKQILMVSGVERYFQIAHCFRDEDLRADRQPEHTQLDLEMSFVHQGDVHAMVEALYTRIVRETRPDATLATPFARLSHAEAVRRFGSDKPDMRFGMELADLTELAAASGFKVFESVAKSGGVVRAIAAPGCAEYGRKQVDELIDLAKSSGAGGLVTVAYAKGPATIDDIAQEGVRSPIKSHVTLDVLKEIGRRTGAAPGDLVLIVAAREKVASVTLSNLRNTLGRRLGLVDDNTFKFAWITDFPMFEWSDEAKRWESAHNPFSAPRAEDAALMESDPGKVHAQQYDLTCNGWELGSGSVRIHRPEVQEKVFKIIGYSAEDVELRFGHFLRAFEYGVPPHAGMGLGLDRLCALLGGETSIREVIAFPKTQTATDPMFESPGPISGEQLKELHIAVAEDKATAADR